jgi:hypothetical protein
VQTDDKPGEPEPTPDVDAWAKPSVELLLTRGIAKGRGDGTFGGRAPITRQEVAVLVARAIRDMRGGEPWTEEQAALLAKV